MKTGEHTHTHMGNLPDPSEDNAIVARRPAPCMHLSLLWSGVGFPWSNPSRTPLEESFGETGKGGILRGITPLDPRAKGNVERI